jgi:hypothetical protein
MNSKVYDFRSLSRQFKVSIERIRAIVLQKELEIDLEKKGFVVSKDYISGIESNLECVNILEVAGDVQNYEKKQLPFRPIFSCVPEGRGFNLNDAKKVIKSTGIDIKTESISDSFTKSIMPAESNSTEIFEESIFESSRYKHIFVDLKKRKSGKASIIVRDRDGTLRTPSREENEYAALKTWNRNAPKFLHNN